MRNHIQFITFISPQSGFGITCCIYAHRLWGIQSNLIKICRNHYIISRIVFCIYFICTNAIKFNSDNLLVLQKICISGSIGHRFNRKLILGICFFYLSVLINFCKLIRCRMTEICPAFFSVRRIRSDNRTACSIIPVKFLRCAESYHITVIMDRYSFFRSPRFRTVLTNGSGCFHTNIHPVKRTLF